MALDKYKYVEEFINPETHQPYENPDSPKMVTTPLGHTFLGHRIAKIKWVERKEKRKKEARVAESGVTVDQGEEEVTVLEAVMGEKGGWIESYDNLSQEGECWVSGEATVHEMGYVCDDAKISGRGDVCGHAKVAGSAEVRGSACVSDNAYIYINGAVGGSARVAVCGEAKVGGTVSGDAVVSERAYVGDGCSVTGNAKVGGMAVLRNNTSVSGKAIVEGSPWLEYSEVGGDAYIDGFAKLRAARVRGNAKVKDNASIEGETEYNESSSDYTVKEWSIIEGKAVVEGNADVVMSTVRGKTGIYANSVVDNMVVNNSSVDNNACLSAHYGDKGSCNNSFIKNNANLCKYTGEILKATIEDNAYVEGPSITSSYISDNAVVLWGGKISGKSTIEGNSHLSGEMAQDDGTGPKKGKRVSAASELWMRGGRFETPHTVTKTIIYPSAVVSGISYNAAWNLEGKDPSEFSSILEYAQSVTFTNDMLLQNADISGLCKGDVVRGTLAGISVGRTKLMGYIEGILDAPTFKGNASGNVVIHESTEVEEGRASFSGNTLILYEGAQPIRNCQVYYHKSEDEEAKYGLECKIEGSDDPPEGESGK